MFTRKFWKDAAERTIRTFAQALLATGGLSHPLGMDWKAVLISSGVTAGLALLSALAFPAKSTAPATPSASVDVIGGKLTVPGASPDELAAAAAKFNAAAVGAAGRFDDDGPNASERAGAAG